MVRSKFKLIYIHRSQFKRFLFNKIKRILRTKNFYKFLQNPKVSIRPFFLLWKRSANITNHYLNNKIAIYNGQLFLFSNVKLYIKGYKFGEVSNTRRKPKHAVKQRQIKKVIKKNNEEKLKKYINVKYVKIKQKSKKKKIKDNKKWD